MASITLLCNDRKLIKTDDENLYSGAINVDTITITFDEIWNNFTNKIGSFFTEKGTNYLVPFDSNIVTIPSEALAEKGYFHFGVYATNGDKRLTSSVLKFRVGEGSHITGGAPGDDMVDVYATINQLLADVEALKNGSSTPGGYTKKIQLDYEGNKIFKNGDTTYNFKMILDTLLTSPNFVFVQYGNRSHLPTFINVDGTTKEIRFASIVLNDGIVKAQSIYLTSNNGVDITNVSISNINSENVSNKATTLDNPNNSTYPTTKAVSDALALQSSQIANFGTRLEALENGQGGSSGSTDLSSIKPLMNNVLLFLKACMFDDSVVTSSLLDTIQEQINTLGGNTPPSGDKIVSTSASIVGANIVLNGDESSATLSNGNIVLGGI